MQQNESMQDETTHRVLQDVSSDIIVRRSDSRQSNRELKSLIETHLIEGLKNEPVFKFLYQNIFYTGSFYEGLKIDAADEYDLNIVMQLPINAECLKLSTEGTHAGHMRITKFRQALEQEQELAKLENQHMRKQMLDWCNDEGNLLQPQFRQWFTGLVSSFIDRNRTLLQNQLRKREIKVSTGGPATTLTLDQLSIDLVPVFEFISPVLAPPPFRHLLDLSWFAVPKPLPYMNTDDVWRVSFGRHERELLHDVGCVKPAVRLIKKLRDSRHWSDVHSYYIKTVALWEIQERNQLCQNSNLEQTFFHFLHCLETRMRTNTLKSFWDNRLNLLQDMHPERREGVARELEKIILKFEEFREQNPRAIGAVIEGYGRVLKLQNLLRDYFNNRKQLNLSVADEATANAVAVRFLSYYNDNAELVRRMLVADLIPLSLGIHTLGDVMAVVIPRLSPFPIRQSGNFTTTVDYQTEILIKVFEGESTTTKENKLLGQFRLTGIPPAPKNVPSFEVTFEVNDKGILTVTAIDRTTRNSSSTTIY